MHGKHRVDHAKTELIQISLKNDTYSNIIETNEHEQDKLDSHFQNTWKRYCYLIKTPCGSCCFPVFTGQ
jgi:hypothetical protein